MIIEVATSTILDITQNVSGIVESLWSIILLVISVPLAFYVIRKITQLFPKR